MHCCTTLKFGHSTICRHTTVLARWWPVRGREGRIIMLFFFISAMVGLRPSSSLSTGCVAPLRGDEPFFATLAQNVLAECDQSGKNLLKYSAMAGNWTRPTGRTDSEIHSFSHWPIVTWIICYQCIKPLQGWLAHRLLFILTNAAHSIRGFAVRSSDLVECVAIGTRLDSWAQTGQLSASREVD